MGEFKGVPIIDDYAHHPTEIKTTIEGIKKAYQDKNIIAVFHPHTFTRTKALFDDFIPVFKGVQELIILDIYGSAREKQGGVHSKDLVKAIKNNNQAPDVVKYIASLQKCEDYLRENISRNDLVLLIGAGDVFRIGENLLK
jgi:UDP-N-acetylmuramate--alanine ligase